MQQKSTESKAEIENATITVGSFHNPLDVTERTLKLNTSGSMEDVIP